MSYYIPNLAALIQEYNVRLKWICSRQEMFNSDQAVYYTGKICK